MKDSLGVPMGTGFLPGQLKLIEEAAAALKIQRCEIIRIGSAVHVQQLFHNFSDL